MVKPCTGSIAYYKDGTPYSADGQVVIVITMKEKQKGKSLGGDDSTVMGGGTAGGVAGGTARGVAGSTSGGVSGGIARGVTGVVSGGAKLDLKYAEYRAVINNSIKLIQKLQAEQKVRSEEFMSSIKRERERNNALTQQNKNRVKINHINVCQLAHDNNRRMEEEAHRIVQMRAIQNAADAKKQGRRQNESSRKLNVS